MAHKQSEWLWGIRVISLADNLIKKLAVHMISERDPNGIVVTDAEMVAGDYFAARNCLEILNLVVEAKGEIEKIREQIQNIE